MMLVHPNKRWSDERRARMSDLHRKRHGAPEGFCTIIGIHVPAEHGEPVRYWAQWVGRNHGEDAATEFVLGLRSENWIGVPRLHDLMMRKKQIAQNRELIRRMVWEGYHANQDRR